MAAAAVLALALGGATYFGVLTIDRAGEEVYGIPGWGVAVTAVLLSLAVVGCVLIVWSRQLAFGALVLAGVAFGALGLLAILSFGVLALLIAGGLLGWAFAHRRPGGRSGRAAAGAVLAGASLPVLVVFGMASPLVDCDVNGVTSGENVFVGLLDSGDGGSRSSASAASSESDDGFSGRAEGPGYAYSYECRDGRLVMFTLQRR